MKILINERQLSKIILEGTGDESILIVGDSHSTDAGWTYSSKLKSTFPNVKIIAKGGMQTSWMLKQLEKELEKNSYDKVIIWGGGNDSSSGKSPATILDNIQKMVDLVNQSGGKAIVVTGYDTDKFSQKLPEKVRKNRIDFQKELKNVKGAKIISAFDLEGDDEEYTSDGIHGNAKAHEQIFTKLSNVLQGLPADKLPKGKQKEFAKDLGKEIETAIDNLTPDTDDGVEKTILDGLKTLGFVAAGLSSLFFSKEGRDAISKFGEKFGFDFDLGKVKEVEKETKVKSGDSTPGTPEDVINFFVSKGLTREQAAGIAGNINVESNFNPKALGDNGTSFGIAQWHKGRWDKLKKWSKDNGVSPESFDSQLKFLWWELNNSENKALSELRKTETPEDAAFAFAKYYERPSEIAQKRMDYAQQYYEA